MALGKFRRSTSDRRVAGLFGGLGDAFGIDPTYLRLGYILLALITGVIPCMIAYFIGWAITLQGAEVGGSARDGDPDRGSVRHGSADSKTGNSEAI